LDHLSSPHPPPIRRLLSSPSPHLCSSSSPNHPHRLLHLHFWSGRRLLSTSCPPPPTPPPPLRCTQPLRGPSMRRGERCHRTRRPGARALLTKHRTPPPPSPATPAAIASSHKMRARLMDCILFG
uniref:Uncharacterized protein n=1 Tax=Triticum urartu TaxID=4572 RepID=A0A8R7QCQ1_TRIUA